MWHLCIEASKRRACWEYELDEYMALWGEPNKPSGWSHNCIFMQCVNGYLYRGNYIMVLDKSYSHIRMTIKQLK